MSKSKRPTFENITLFVLVGSKDTREVRRAPLSSSVERELLAHFKARYEADYPESHEVLPFVPGYRGERHEISEIADFEIPTYIADAMRDPALPAVIRDEEIETTARVLVAFDPESKLLLFQHLDSRTVIRRGFALVLSNDVFKKQDAAGLVIGNQIHAVLHGTSLRFHQFYFASRIFDLTSRFDAASDVQVTEFLSHQRLADVKKTLFHEALDTWSRQKICAIQRSGNLDRVKPAIWKKAAKKCGVDLKMTNDDPPMIILPTERKELKRVLRLLDDDYLDSIINDANTYQVNSKRPISRGNS